MGSLVEKCINKVYLIMAVLVGLSQSLEIPDAIYQWNHDAYGAWVSPLLEIWMKLSLLFLVYFLLRRRFQLSLSPASYFFQFLLLMLFGPLMISPESAHTGKHKLEFIDIFMGSFGLLFAAFNIWLLVRYARR